MTKLEEIARAIRDTEYPENTPEEHKLSLTAYLPQARAAVEAMREPNPAILAAHMHAMTHRNNDETGFTHTRQWQAGIDAILNEKP